MDQVPLSRVTVLKDETPNIKESSYVVYWMITFNRIQYNYALQRAVEWANKLRTPLEQPKPI